MGFRNGAEGVEEPEITIDGIEINLLSQTASE